MFEEGSQHFLQPTTRGERDVLASLMRSSHVVNLHVQSARVSQDKNRKCEQKLAANWQRKAMGSLAARGDGAKFRSYWPNELRIMCHNTGAVNRRDRHFIPSFFEGLTCCASWRSCFVQQLMVWLQKCHLNYRSGKAFLDRSAQCKYAKAM